MRSYFNYRRVDHKPSCLEEGGKIHYPMNLEEGSILESLHASNASLEMRGFRQAEFDIALTFGMK